MHVWMKFKAFFDELFMQLRSLSCLNSRQMRRAAEERYSLRNAADADMFFKLHRILGRQENQICRRRMRHTWLLRLLLSGAFCPWMSRRNLVI